FPAPPHRVSRAAFASMPPTTQNLRRRDGRADRRQTPVLTLTAQCLRRRRGFTASVFGRVPRAVGHPSDYSPAAPHRVMPDEGRRSCLYQIQRVRKRGNFEKSPVSSMEFGTMGRRDFSRKSGIFRSSSMPMAIWNFYAGVPLAAHGGARYSSPHPPGHSSRRADSFARGGGESHPPPRRRSSRSQGAGTAASDQGGLAAGGGRPRRQGLSRLGRGGRPAAGPAGGRPARLNETRPPPRGFARRRVKVAWCRRLTCARESRRSP